MLQRILLTGCLVLSSASPSWAGLMPGTPMADISIPTPAGKAIDLKEYRGKSVVIVIVSTTCKDCAEAVQYLAKLQTELRPRGLQVVGVVGDANGAKTTKPFVDRYRPGFPFGYLDQDSIVKLARLPEDSKPFAPILLFVDTKAMGRLRLFGDNDDLKRNLEGTIRSDVEDLLKEAAAKGAAPKTAAPAAKKAANAAPAAPKP